MAMARYDMPSPGDGYLALVLDADLRLLDAADRLRQHWAAHAAALGLTPIQAKVLLRLPSGEAIPMRKLAQQLDYDASNLTTLVDKLAGHGALERRADPPDGRGKALALTAQEQSLRGGIQHTPAPGAGPLAPLREPDLRALTRLLATLDQPAG